MHESLSLQTNIQVVIMSQIFHHFESFINGPTTNLKFKCFCLTQLEFTSNATVDEDMWSPSPDDMKDLLCTILFNICIYKMLGLEKG